MSRPVLRADALVKRYGGLLATDAVSLSLHHGQIHALIGPNGAGKTTLIQQLAGQLRPESGRIYLLHEHTERDVTQWPADARARMGLARSYQITSIFHGFTVLENVMLAVQAQQGHSYRFWRAVQSDPSLTAPAMHAIERVGLASQANTLVDALAHGEHRQIELAMVLAAQPSVLLLDEPMAGMSQREADTMTQLLASLKSDYAMLLIEHDMQAVFALADTVSVLVYGKVLMQGTPEQVKRDSAVREAYLGDEWADTLSDEP
jgi:branched-chain amino acid transport system ATP-binding protein